MSTKRIIKMIIVFLVLLISGCEIRVTVNSPYNKNSLFSDVITEEESSQLLEEYAEKRLPLGTIVVLQGVEYYVMVSGYD
ncbi:MAG: hypothetical protein LBR25_00005, partial [Erysipelotrichaceae bacterium]|nr:hypothetical protein [Erysipelotrichaceae bacterium]